MWHRVPEESQQQAEYTGQRACLTIHK